MADPFSPLAPGDDLNVSAVAWNAMLAAGRDRRQPGRPDAAGVRRVVNGRVEHLALNDTGADLGVGKPAAVAGAGGYDLADTAQALAWLRNGLLTLGVPATDTDFVVVTLEPIPDGKIGWVAVSGTALCDIASASGSTRWARAAPGSTASLTASDTSGTVRVLHVPATGTPKRCAVYLHERPGPGEACAITPSVARDLIGVYTVKSGANVTDVYQRFQDVTTDADGCETRGDVYCVVAGASCGSGAREVDYYCIDGVCWAYYDGIVPGTYDAGPFATPELCDDGCGPVVTSCGTVSRTLEVTYLGLTCNIVWDGVDRWTGYTGTTFDCTNGFGLELICTAGTWSINAIASFTGPDPGGTIVPTSTSPFLYMYTGGSTTGGGSCGTINFTIAEV